MATLPKHEEVFKNHLIALARKDYDDGTWQTMLKEAH